MKEVLVLLNRVREESKHIVDKSTLKCLDEAIQNIERVSQSRDDGITTLELLSWAAKLIALVKFLTGDTSPH